MSEKDIEDGKDTKRAFITRQLNPVATAKGLIESSAKGVQRDTDFLRSGINEFTRRFMATFRRGARAEAKDLRVFSDLLEVWGILPEQITTVTRNMFFAILGNVFVIFLSVLGIMNATNLYAFGVLICLFLVSIYGSLILAWRIWVLRKERYVSMWDFLTFKREKR